jgi:hypothetical protein
MTTGLTNYTASNNGIGSTVQIQTAYSTTYTTLSGSSNTWAEASSTYRVSITPQFASSMIVVTYYIPLGINWGTKNILYTLQGVRSINGGSFTNLVSSVGSSNGSRNQISGNGFRPLNCYDGNDQQAEHFTLIDYPNTTSSVSYGFQIRYEANGNTIKFGTGASTNYYNGCVTIVAEEIKQLGN